MKILPKEMFKKKVERSLGRHEAWPILGQGGREAGPLWPHRSLLLQSSVALPEGGTVVMKKGRFARDVTRLSEGHAEMVTRVELEDLHHQAVRQQKPVWQSQDSTQGPEPV